MFMATRSKVTFRHILYIMQYLDISGACSPNILPFSCKPQRIFFAVCFILTTEAFQLFVPRLVIIYHHQFTYTYVCHGRIQNEFIFTHSQENLENLCLESLPFHNRGCSQREQILSFKSSPYVNKQNILC